MLLLVTSVKTNVLQTTFLKNELEKNDIYGVAFSIVDEQIMELELAPEIPITHKEISSLVTNVLTPTWLQGNVENVLDDFDTWLNAPEGTDISIILDMAGPKANLISEFDSLLEKKSVELIPCSEGGDEMFCKFAGMGLDDIKAELVNFDFDPLDLVNKIPDKININDLSFIDSFGKVEADSDKPEIVETFLCSDYCPGPEEDYLANVYKDVQDEKTCNELGGKLQTVEGWGKQNFCLVNDDSKIEDERDIATQVAEIKEQLEVFKEYYNLGIKFFWYGWVMYGVLVALFIVMNATGGWRRVVRWLGVLFLAIGLLPLLFGLASGIGQELAMENISIDSDISTQVTDLIPELITDLRQAIFTLPLVVGIVLVVLGLGGIIGAHWIPKQKGKEK